MPVTPRDAIVRTSQDLFALWQSLMGDGGFGRRSLWLLFLYDDGQVAPVIVPIEDIPVRPGVQVTNLGTIVADLREDGVSSAAMLLSRPGPSNYQGRTQNTQMQGPARTALEDTVHKWYG